MQFHFENSEYQKMMDLYPRLIESIVEFRVYYRKIIADRKKVAYSIDPQFETCPLAKGFKITKIKDYQYKCEKVKEDIEQDVEQLDKDTASKSEKAVKREESKATKVAKEEVKKQEEDIKPVAKPVQEEKMVTIPLGTKSITEANGNNLAVIITAGNKNEAVSKAQEDTQKFWSNNDVKSTLQPGQSVGQDQNTANLESNNAGAQNKRAAMRNNKDQGSHAIMKIEMEEADKNGGMCSCSK